MQRRRILKRLLAALLTFAVWPAPVVAQKKPGKPRERTDVARFRARVEAVLADSRADKGHWAVLVRDAETGTTLFDLNGHRFFVPASNTKLFTTALALARLGSTFRFATSIETRGTLDANGRLLGDLVLVGRGDPNLSNRKFPYEKKVERDGLPEKVLAELADLVVSRGIRQVDGDIVADDGYLPYERYPSGWSIDNMNEEFSAPVSAIAVNDNSVVIDIRPGAREGEPASFRVEPWADFYSFRNETTTIAAGARGQLTVTREPGSREVVLRGAMPLELNLTQTLAVEEPAEHAAALLKRLLESRGVRILGRALARHAPSEDAVPGPASAHAPAASPQALVVLAEHTSPPLLEAARVVNKVSQNLHAELLLRAVARETLGDGSSRTSLRLLQEFCKEIGIEEGDVELSDGSGLSRRNLVTPRAVTQLLRYASRQPWGEAFAATLPVAGEDGTLERRLKDTPAAGRIHAKTGSLDHVNALSGYATTLHGTRLVFSLFGNNHNLRGRDATSILDAISVAMIEELGAPVKKRR